MNDFQDDFQPIVKKIVQLMEDSRANAAFNDYMYEESKTKDIFELLGKALEHNYMTTKPAENERFIRLLNKAFTGRVPAYDKINSIRSASDLHRAIGDQSLFIYLFTIDNVTYINDVSSNILDTLVSYFSKAAMETQLGGYVILTRGLMRKFQVRRDVFEHVPQEIKNLRDSARYIDQTVEQAWFSRIDNYLQRNGIHGAKPHPVGSGANEHWFVELDVMEVLDKFDLSPAERAELLKQPTITRNIIDTDNIIAKCGLAKGAKDAAIKIGMVLAAYNIMMELTLIEKSNGILECIPRYTNILGSLLPIIDTVTQLKYTRFFAPGTYFVMAATYCVKFGISLWKGEQGSALFNLGAAISFTGAGLSVLGLSSAPVLAWVAVAIICSMLAEYFAYDDLDYYLEYCIWGMKYKEDWKDVKQKLPSWWPSNKLKIDNITSLKTPIRIGSTIQKQIAYRLNSTTSNEDTIKANQALFDMVQQIPSYKMEANQNAYILQYAYSHQFVLNLRADDFPSMDSMEMVLSYEDGKDQNEEIKYTPFRTQKLDLNDQNNHELFYFSQNGSSIPIESFDNLNRANSFQVLWIPSKKTLLEAVNKYEQANRATKMSTWNDVQRVPLVQKSVFEEPQILTYKNQRKKIQIELLIRYRSPALRPVQMVTVW